MYEQTDSCVHFWADEKNNTNNKDTCTSNTVTCDKTKQNVTAGETKKEKRKLLVMLRLAQKRKRKTHSSFTVTKLVKRWA